MSIFNALVAPHRAVVAADTSVANWREDGTFGHIGHAQKFYSVATMQAVFVGRGRLDFVEAASFQLAMSGYEDIAKVAAPFAEFLEQYIENDKATRDSGDGDLPFGADPAVLKFSGALVGFSPSRGACVGVSLIEPSGANWGKIYERGPFMGAVDQIADWDRLKRLATGNPSLEAARELARMQFDQLTPAQQQLGFGGHLTTAVIDEGGIRLGIDRDFFDAASAGAAALPRAERRRREREARKAGRA
ncbi:hypothetical protein [Ferruginivarius sediminum]|uniref:Uncharacterized protein n=1 Tax=Ferruginivarius sediminum TaxID=2661937 RepID=A0A369TEN6_9PROT|nr:hypothetical protein [Ferruginivarius sediminum]RDD63821.1 hypothetical protein DRB17_01245 [Ferruginivarius sediminum]